MKVVVYYRCRPSEPLDSEAALLEQCEAVDKWLREHPAEVEAEYLEVEAGGFSRPQLSQAIEACRRINATLLIARTEAIGSGADFCPRVASVPVAIAEQPVRDLGYTVPAPVNTPSGMSLRFSSQPGAKDFAVYLCNGTNAALHDINIQVTGVTSREASADARMRIGDAALKLYRIEGHSAAIVDFYDLMSDGDFISVYDIDFVDALNQRHALRALIGPGLLPSGFVVLQNAP